MKKKDILKLRGNHNARALALIGATPRQLQECVDRPGKRVLCRATLIIPELMDPDNTPPYILGFFSTRAKARAAIEKATGLRDYELTEGEDYTLETLRVDPAKVPDYTEYFKA